MNKTVFIITFISLSTFCQNPLFGKSDSTARAISYPINLAFSELKFGLEFQISNKYFFEFAPSILTKNTYRSERFGFGLDLNFRKKLSKSFLNNKIPISTYTGFEVFYRYHQDASWGWDFPDLRTHYIANQVAASWNIILVRMDLNHFFVGAGLGAAFSKSFFNTYESEMRFDDLNIWAGHTGPFLRTRLTFGLNIN